MFNIKQRKFFKKNFTIIILLVLFIVGLLLRLYKLSQLLIFAYDQGRDAIVINQMIATKNFIRLIGPITGIPGVFIGPFFYYLLLPFYWIGGGDPIYPAVFLSLLGALAIFAIYVLGRQFLTKKYALCAVFLFTFTYGLIQSSRWLSNPSPLILLSILFFYSFLKSIRGNLTWSIIAGILLGLCLQTELANAIFFIPIIFLYVLFNYKQINKPFYKFLLLILFTLFTLSPLIIFDYRHDYLISKAIQKAFQDKSTQTSLDYILKIRPAAYARMIKSSLIPNTFLLDIFLLGTIMLSVIMIIFSKIKGKLKSESIMLILFWFLIPLIGLLFYTGNYGQIWDYYLVTLPIPSILLIVYFMQNAENYNFFRIRIDKNIIVLVFLCLYAAFNYHEWSSLINANNYGYSISLQKKAIQYTLEKVQSKNFSVFIFVPNGQTESYDYLYSWILNKKNMMGPSTVSLDNKEFFLIYEPDPYLPEKRFGVWYEKYNQYGKIIDKVQFGIITVEHRIQ